MRIAISRRESSHPTCEQSSNTSRRRPSSCDPPQRRRGTQRCGQERHHFAGGGTPPPPGFLSLPTASTAALVSFTTSILPDTSAESSLSRFAFLQILHLTGNVPQRDDTRASPVCRNVDLPGSRYQGRCEHQRGPESVSPAPPWRPRLLNSFGSAYERVPDLDQPLQLLVHGIRRTPVFLHREVSEQKRSGSATSSLVQGSQFDRSVTAPIRTRAMMILVVACERIQCHVLPLTETTIGAGVQWRKCSRHRSR